MVHGSMSTLDFTPFSDFDTQIFIAEKAFESPENLKKIGKVSTESLIYLQKFDPIQHGKAAELF